MPYSPMQLAEAFIQSGELHDALDALNQELDANPGDDSARRLRIGVLLRLADDEHLRQALADFEPLAHLTADDYTQQSVILERLRDLEGALAAMSIARELNPADARLAERSLHLLIAQGKTSAALELVRAQTRSWRWLQWEGDLLAMRGEDVMATARYGLALAQVDEHFDSAVDRYIAPIKARLLLARADAYRRLGQIEQADSHYLDAANLIPDDPTIPFNRGLLAMLQDELPDALELCRQGLTNASPMLRAEMEKTLRADPRYSELVLLLLESD
jgi:tetratricopeptide (TPR) repeat protein